MHKQSMRRKIKGAVDMSAKPDIAPPDEGAPRWERPPAHELDEPTEPYEGALPKGDPEVVRLLIRPVSHATSFQIVAFALVLQTFHRSAWCTVAEIDSSHDTDVHLHRYARATKARIGDPEILRAIDCLADVQDGYNAALSYVEANWAQLVEGWRHA